MQHLELKPILGGEEITQEGMSRIPTPPETETWKPMPHIHVYDTILFALNSQQYQIGNVNLSITHEGKRLFGLMQIQHKHEEDNGYGLVFGFGNAHDKTFAVTLAMGAGVWICSNLSFFGRIVLKRRHTKYLERDLEGLVHRGLIQLGEENRAHHKRISLYKERVMTDNHAGRLIVDALKSHIISPGMAVPIWDNWLAPSHREFQIRNVYSLLNSFSAVMSRMPFEHLPRRTQALHKMLDDVCHFN